MIRRIWTRLPDGRLKRAVRPLARLATPRRTIGRFLGMGVLLAEIRQLAIEYAGEDSSGTAVIRLRDGKVFFGHPSEANDLATYGRLLSKLRPRIPASCIRLACDIVCRFKFPHADAASTPPYPLWQRNAMHLTHQDTILDIPGLSRDERKQLRNKFRIKPGDVIVDVGAFLGLGAMKLSELVGPAGHVLSVEVHPENQALFERNVQANDARNVQLVRSGVWNQPTEITLSCDSSQRNSLVEGVVNAKSDMRVRADTLDAIIRRFDLPPPSLISLTINGAEPEALAGAETTLDGQAPNVVLAGWYKRDGKSIHAIASVFLKRYGYKTLVGRRGRLYAWR